MQNIDEWLSGRKLGAPISTREFGQLLKFLPKDQGIRIRVGNAFVKLSADMLEVDPSHGLTINPPHYHFPD